MPKKGVTLIELVLVICIFVIVGSSAVIYFKNIERRTLYLAAVELKNDLRFLQRMAISHNKNYYMDFYQDQNRYELTRRASNGINHLSISKNQFTSGVKIHFVTSNWKLHYTNKGTVSSGGTIALRNDRYEVSVTVLPVTGRVNIEPLVKLKK